MANITATFQSGVDESTQFSIFDSGLDHDAPPVVWQGYLAPGDSTEPVSLYSADGLSGTIFYQRTNGQRIGPTDVWAGAVVTMSE